MDVWTFRPTPLDCLICDGPWLHVESCPFTRIARRQKEMDTLAFRVLGPFVRPTTAIERADRADSIGPYALVDAWDSWSFAPAPLDVGPFFEEVA